MTHRMLLPHIVGYLSFVYKLDTVLTSDLESNTMFVLQNAGAKPILRKYYAYISMRISILFFY